jgi:hypothetical protein
MRRGWLCWGRFPLFTIAPEGTCKNGNCLLTFSTGAFVGGRPVLPVLLRYRARCDPMRQLWRCRMSGLSACVLLLVALKVDRWRQRTSSLDTVICGVMFASAWRETSKCVAPGKVVSCAGLSAFCAHLMTVKALSNYYSCSAAMWLGS